MKSMKSYKTIDAYIKAAPKEVQPMLKKLRKIIKEAAPKTEEVISYGIPTFRLNGNLVHFGCFKDHIGFFPGSAPIQIFKKELSKYKTSKGTIQLPLDMPLPAGLIKKIVTFCVKRNLERTK